MTGKDLQQAEIVCVELVAAELGDDEDPDGARPVLQRHGEQRLLDLGRTFDVLADSGVCGVARQKRLAGRRDVTRDPDSDLRDEHLEGRLRALRQLATECNGPELVSVAEKDATVVVVDQLAELIGDRRPDLGHLEQAGELARDAVQHLQVGDRADVHAARDRRVRPLVLFLVEDDDAALAPRLGGHHRNLGAGDELSGIRGMIGPERNPDRDGQRPDRVELRDRDPLGDTLRKGLSHREVAGRDDDRELLTPDPADVVVLAHRGAELIGEGREHVVSDRVAVDVVDTLEVVEVEHQIRRRIRARRTLARARS